MEFYQIPKALFQEKYKNLSNDAKVAYALMYAKLLQDETYDEEGNYYLTYRISRLKEDLQISPHVMDRINRELTEYDLLERNKVGVGKPYRLYLMKP